MRAAMVGGDGRQPIRRGGKAVTETEGAHDRVRTAALTAFRSPYERWKESQGLSTIRGLAIPNLLEVDLTPWESRGGNGVFINLEGSSGFNDAYLCEIP